MKITKFDRNNCGSVRRILEQVLQNAGIEGVTITTSTGRFSDNEYGFKVSVQTTATSSDGNEIGSVLKDAMRIHNLTKTEANGKTLVDYHSRKRRFPFIVEHCGGGRFKYTVAQVKAEFS